MKNKIFQFVWYYIVRPCIPIPSIKKEINPVIRHGREIYVQIRLARFIGQIEGFLAGDSNSAVFSTFMVMQRFSTLTLAIGQGGATADDWVAFFMTDRGRYVYKAMIARGVTVVWNIGGNYVLLGTVDKAVAGLHALHNLFLRSWFCTIPPIYASVLGKISEVAGFPERDEKYYRQGVLYVNGLIEALARPRVIDLYHQFVTDTGAPLFGALQDLVHFRRVSVDFIRMQLGGVI
jgi:hypothetical protein